MRQGPGSQQQASCWTEGGGGAALVLQPRHRWLNQGDMAVVACAQPARLSALDGMLCACRLTASMSTASSIHSMVASRVAGATWAPVGALVWWTLAAYKLPAWGGVHGVGRAVGVLL